LEVLDVKLMQKTMRSDGGVRGEMSLYRLIANEWERSWLERNKHRIVTYQERGIPEISVGRLLRGIEFGSFNKGKMQYFDGKVKRFVEILHRKMNR